MKKDSVCSHCGAINQHFSFQCVKIRKPIKKTATPIGSFTMTSNKTREAVKNHKADKSVPDLLKLAEIVFNRFIRDRDSQTDNTFQCISCGFWKSKKDMQAGHFFSKVKSAIRFDEDNVNGQCSTCNEHLYGNFERYETGLRNKIGNERVEQLYKKSKLTHKWTKEELNELIKKYK